MLSINPFDGCLDDTARKYCLEIEVAGFNMGEP